LESSQLSPFLQDTGAKLFTKQKVVKTVKFPKEQNINKAIKLLHHNNLEAQKISKTSSNYTKLPNKDQAKDLEMIRLNKLEKRFEYWMRSPLLTDKAKQEFDKSCKELKMKGCVAFSYRKLEKEKKIREQYINTLDPYEKLKEKFMINTLFGEEIKKKLQQFAEEQHVANKFSTRNPCKIKKYLRTTSDIIPDVKRNKSKLQHDINKIKARYCDAKEVAAKEKAIKETKAIERFANRIKRENEFKLNELNAVFARSNKKFYNN